MRKIIKRRLRVLLSTRKWPHEIPPFLVYARMFNKRTERDLVTEFLTDSNPEIDTCERFLGPSCNQSFCRHLIWATKDLIEEGKLYLPHETIPNYDPTISERIEGENYP